MSCASFRKHVLPKVRPVKYSKRLVRYDSDEIDQAIAAMRGLSAPSPAGEEAAWLAKLDEDSGARR